MFRVMDKGVYGHGHNRVSSETLTNLLCSVHQYSWLEDTLGWGKAGDTFPVVFGEWLELPDIVTSRCPGLPPCLLLLLKMMGDRYGQGRVLILGEGYSLRRITKTGTWTRN